LPAVYSAAGVSFTGANALATDFLRPYQGYGDVKYWNFDGNSQYNSLQVGANRRFARALTLGLAYTLSKTTTTVSTDGIYTNIVNTRAYDTALANFDRTHFFVGTFIWDLPKGARLLGGNAFARVILNNWTLSGNTTIATGSPNELGLSISGQDAGNRLLGTPTNGNLSGLQPRFFLNGDPQTGSTINPSAFVVPGIGAIGPYPRMYLRNPGIGNQDLSVSKNIVFGGEGKRYLQLRIEAFNVLNRHQFSGYNLGTNVTNATGATGNSIFSNYTGLTVSNNLRPAGSTQVLGTYFGEFNGARDMRMIQVAAKFYF
jgi:hypothetical protein